MNIAKTFLLLTFLTLLFILIGGMIGGPAGVRFAFILACLMNLGAYWFSDTLVLAMYGAKPLVESETPEVYEMVRQLCDKAGLPMPRIYRIPSDTPNAFATGRNPSHAVVAVTDGIIKLLNYEELKGVLGHELAHVKHRDILIASIAATIAGAISMLASMARWSMMFGGGRSNDREEGANPIAILLMAILAPIAAMLIQMAISRSREYDADSGGAEFCGNPLYLAGALEKLEIAQRQIPMQGVNPATAHLFIVNPLRGGGIASLFSTHPPIQERISRLQEMAMGKITRKT
jgi:heat shock protein HtpX